MINITLFKQITDMYRRSFSLLWFNGFKSQYSVSDKQYNAIFNVCCRNRSSKNSFKNSIKSQIKVTETLEGTLLKQTKSEQTSVASLIKPTIFTVVFSSASFAGATIWQYENMRNYAQQLVRSPKKWVKDKLIPANLWIQDKISGNMRLKQGSFRQICNKWWNSLPEGEKVFIPILFVNILIYSAWRLPALHKTMTHYFCSNTGGKILCWPMVLSVFSHQNGIHLICNMFVLNSFINSTVNNLGKEQFLAFYASAGVVSSLTSLIYRVITAQKSSSLGASGAIMGMIGYVCLKFPDTLLSVVFLPFLVFKAGAGIKGLIAFDALGLLMKWKLFDHSAHLGGALFGLFWCYWGNLYVWQQRGPFLEWWHNQRGRSQ